MYINTQAQHVELAIKPTFAFRGLLLGFEKPRNKVFCWQAWSDKINNLLLLAVGTADAAAGPPGVASFTISLDGTHQGTITAIVPYAARPALYFVQVCLRQRSTAARWSPLA